MPPRVLIASHLFPSKTRPNSAPWLAEQAGALAGAGVTVEALCCSPFESGGEQILRPGSGAIRVHYRSTSAGVLNGTRAGLALSALRYNGRALAFLARRRRDFDLIHAHFGFPDGYVAVRVGAEMGLPVIVTLHGSDVTRALAREGAAGARIRATIARATHVVCVSEALADRARTLLPASTPVSVIPNGYDDVVFRLRPTGVVSGAGAQSLTAVERDHGYLFVGALREVKNIRTLVESYRKRPELHSLPLTIVGDGPLGSEIAGLARHMPAGARVTLLGELDRQAVANAMRRARALVLPSSEEGYGVVAAEALACGTPVVASSVGGLPEILAGEAAGILVEPGDVTALEDALVQIASWPHSPAAVASASGALNWRDRVAEIIALYERVLNDAQRGGEQR